MKVVSPPIVEYWMEKCMILRRFERLEKKVYCFLKAQGSNLHATIVRHSIFLTVVNDGGLNVVAKRETSEVTFMSIIEDTLL